MLDKTEAANPATTTFAQADLRAIIERAERVEEERRALGDDLKDIYAEARSKGYDVKAIKVVMAMRRKDPDERAEQETVLGLYLSAMGMRSHVHVREG